MLYLQCLGDLVVSVDGVVNPALTNSKAAALWTVVALEARPVARAQLAEWFWPDAEPSMARSNLRFTLSHLRRNLAGGVDADRDSVRLPEGLKWTCDLGLLDEPSSLESEALSKLAGLRVESFLAAVRARHSDAFTTWADAWRDRLIDKAVQHHALAAQQLRQVDRSREAAGQLQRWLSLQPWAEDAHLGLMSLYADAGHRAAALAQFETCRSWLERELDVEPSAATRAFAQRLRAEGAAADSPRGADVVLPQASAFQPDGGSSEVASDALAMSWTPWNAPLVGRERELRWLDDVLASPDARMVTLFGPGGSGKTALALAALRAQDSMPGVFVPLADLSPQASGTSTPLVMGRIAQRLDLNPAPGDPVESLAAAIPNAPLLLVLDNLEQLSDSAAGLQRLLQAKPGLRLLITSRHLLGLPLEWSMRVGGLSEPAAQILFLQTARRVCASLQAQAHEQAVVRIARATDGLPLALELAARWLHALPADEIASRLERDLALIRGGAPGHPGAGMAAAIDRSVALLQPVELRAYAALGLFRGGFDIDTGTFVAGCDAAVLGQLVAKSMLRPGADERLELHPLLREAAAAQLDRLPDADEVRERLVRVMAARLEQAMHTFTVDADPVPLQALERDRGDLLAAAEHRLARGDVEGMARLLPGLWELHRLHGWYEEAVLLLQRSLALPGLPPALSLRWHVWLSDARFQLGRHEDARAAAIACLSLAGEPAFESVNPVRRVAGEMLQLFMAAPRLSMGPSSVCTTDVVAAYDRLAHLVFFEGARTRYVGTHLRAINLAKGHEQAALLASASLVLMYTPLKRRSRDYAERAERVLSLAAPRDRAWAHEQLCLRALSLGEFGVARRHADSGRDLFARLRSRRSWSECAALGSYTELFEGRPRLFAERMACLMAGAVELNEPAGIAWAGAAHHYMSLRMPEDAVPMVVELSVGAVDECVSRVVDPNTQLLWQGVRAWHLVRRGETDAARRTLYNFLRLDRDSTMPGIYALNGFTGALCAAAELQDRSLCSAVLAALARFARTLPGARSTLALLQARWAAEMGDARGSARALDRLSGLLPADADTSGFTRGLMPASR